MRHFEPVSLPLYERDAEPGSSRADLPGAPGPVGPPDWEFGASGTYGDYIVPYVASFDREFVLGLKKKGDDPFDKPWTQVSILPHF